MTFGERLKAVRKNKGITQQTLADGAGTSLRSIQNYESNMRMPNSLSIVQKIATTLEVSTEYLLEGLQIEDAGGAGPVKGKQQIATLVAEIQGLFAGGELPEEDKDAMFRAVMDAYWDAKAESTGGNKPKPSPRDK